MPRDAKKYKNTRCGLSKTSLHTMGDYLLMPLETLPGSAQVLSPPGTTLFCSNVLPDAPPCTIICVHAFECSVIGCALQEGRDVSADVFSNGSRKGQWQTWLNKCYREEWEKS